MSSDVQHIIEAPLGQSVIVRAGPGAGKTHLIGQRLAWLLNLPVRQNHHIACITYTNTGVEEVQNKLVPHHFVSLPAHLFIGTIHKFLIDFVLMPYGHYLKELPHNFKITAPSGFAASFYPHRKNQPTPPAHRMLSFENIGYNLDGSLVCYRKSQDGWTPPDWQMSLFKQHMHRKGYLDLNDTLFFAWRVLTTFPFVADCLAARFGAIVVDEFQDTTLYQNQILRLFVNLGRTSLFLVADPDQSIYSFAGAVPHTLSEYESDPKFRCPECGKTTHVIPENRRSSKLILDLLNGRSTMPQGQRALAKWVDWPEPVRLLVGDYSQILAEFHRLMQRTGLDVNVDGTFCVLAYKNEVVSELKAVYGGSSVAKSILEDLSNRRLRSILRNLLAALRHKEFGEWALAFEATDNALTQLVFEGASPLFCTYDDPTVGLNRELWKNVVWAVMYNLGTDGKQTVLDWGKSLKDLIDQAVVQFGGHTIKKARLSILDCRGKANSGLKKCTVADEMLGVVRPNLMGDSFRTIHKAKGIERDAVLAVAENNTELEKWLCVTDIAQEEESRFGYVAFSRARKLLCIGIKDLSSQAERAAREMEMVITDLNARQQLLL